MTKRSKSVEFHAPWLAVFASLVLHIAFVVAMRWQRNEPTPIIIEKPQVSRIRILANPNGSPQAAVKPIEMKAPPLAKPQPKNKVKPKNKTLAKSKVKTKLALRKPQKPEKAREDTPPPPATNNAPQSFGDSQEIGMVGKGMSNTKGPSDPGANSNWLPLEQVKPKMPPEAALKGIEGFVTFSFDINEEGRVENIRVREAENRSVFENEARKAIRKFRYAPRKINGRPVRVVDHSFTVVFTLTH